MSSNPLLHLQTMNECTLAMWRQLAQAANAGMGELAAQLPEGQAQLARLMKSNLALGKEWKTLQADAFSQLLHCQLAAFQPQRATPLHELMELHEVLGSDLAAQRKTAMQALTERLAACVDDLRKAQCSEEISLVLGCYFDDVGSKLRANAEQTLGLLNSAGAATSILTARLLDNLSAAAPAP